MEEQSAFKEFDTKTNSLRRRNLLPIWIKIFTWIFLFLGLAGILILPFGFFVNEINLSIYGLNTRQPYSLTGLTILFLLIFKGIVSYGLGFEQKWGPSAAIVDAILGLSICGFVMLILPFVSGSRHFTIRFEILVLIPYLTKMLKIKKAWTALS